MRLPSSLHLACCPDTLDPIPDAHNTHSRTSGVIVQQPISIINPCCQPNRQPVLKGPLQLGQQLLHSQHYSSWRAISGQLSNATSARAGANSSSTNSSCSSSQAVGPGHSSSSSSTSSLVIASPAESSSAAGPSSSTSSSNSSSGSSAPVRSWSELLKTAGAHGLGGGLPGSAAMVVQVLSLMWLRTTVNYQYRFGTSTSVALRTLYREGGIPRFYQGLAPALLQGPLCRFGDTAANAGVLSLLNDMEQTRNLPVGVKTAAASGAAASWRMLLLPIDATKTMMQVEGRGGLKHLYSKVRHSGPGVLYHGAFASVGATFVGHYPWFTTYNYLNQLLPQYDELHLRLLRSAGMGFCAGVTSDVVSNSIRVIKTTRQTARRTMSYREVVRSIVAQDGVSGLFTRGLTTRIAANGLQNICFTVLWNLGQDRLQQSGFIHRMEGK